MPSRKGMRQPWPVLQFPAMRLLLGQSNSIAWDLQNQGNRMCSKAKANSGRFGASRFGRNIDSEAGKGANGLGTGNHQGAEEKMRAAKQSLIYQLCDKLSSWTNHINQNCGIALLAESAKEQQPINLKEKIAPKSA